MIEANNLETSKVQPSAIDGLESEPPLLLPAILDLAAAPALLEQLLQRSTNGGSLRLDASVVDVLTYPCIQIILAAIRTCDEVFIANPSIAFASAFEDLAIDWRQGLAPTKDDAVENASSQPCTSDQPQPLAPDNATVQSDQTTQANEATMATRILTIDDSKTMRDMLMLTLADAGFDVLQAVDGQDGLDVLDKEQVDVVITDINMPRMDGYEVIRQLRRSPTHKSLPVLVLTTESEMAKKNLAREVGATGWMVKPFDPERLIATVRKVAS